MWVSEIFLAALLRKPCTVLWRITQKIYIFIRLALLKHYANMIPIGCLSVYDKCLLASGPFTES